MSTGVPPTKPPETKGHFPWPERYLRRGTYTWYTYSVCSS
jgi:hypothetical protein